MKSDIFDGIAGGWRPDVLERIRAAVSGTKSGDQPVVVFDFDNTCIAGDIGELFAQYMIEGLYYRCDETFWSLVDEEDGREDLRDLVQRCRRPAHWGGRTLDDVPQNERTTRPFEPISRRCRSSTIENWPAKAKRAAIPGPSSFTQVSLSQTFGAGPNMRSPTNSAVIESPLDSIKPHEGKTSRSTGAFEFSERSGI